MVLSFDKRQKDYAIKRSTEILKRSFNKKSLFNSFVILTTELKLSSIHITVRIYKYVLHGPLHIIRQHWKSVLRSVVQRPRHRLLNLENNNALQNPARQINKNAIFIDI